MFKDKFLKYANRSHDIEFYDMTHKKIDKWHSLSLYCYTKNTRLHTQKVTGCHRYGKIVNIFRIHRDKIFIIRFNSQNTKPTHFESLLFTHIFAK